MTPVVLLFIALGFFICGLILIEPSTAHKWGVLCMVAAGVFLASSFAIKITG
jgi:hypothetical protein